MADTIREQIIAAYVTRLAAWTTANGYHYSCGASAQRAVQNVEPKDLPACVLWPQAETVEQLYGRNVCEMVVKVEALATVGDTNPSVIQEKLLRDVIKIMTEPLLVPVTTKIEDIVYTGGGPAGIAKPEEETTAVYAEFKIKYETLIGNPYSQ